MSEPGFEGGRRHDFALAAMTVGKRGSLQEAPGPLNHGPMEEEASRSGGDQSPGVLRDRCWASFNSTWPFSPPLSTAAGCSVTEACSVAM